MVCTDFFLNKSFITLLIIFQGRKRVYIYIFQKFQKSYSSIYETSYVTLS